MRARVRSVLRHEVVNANGAAQHFFNVARRRVVVVEAVFEVIGRGFKLFNELIDVVLGSRVIKVACV
jgi:hypothetical protein